MIRDFFQMFLQSQEQWKSAGLRDVDPLFEYIYRYWHLSTGDLRPRPLDLEEVFTFITLQLPGTGKRLPPADAYPHCPAGDIHSRPHMRPVSSRPWLRVSLTGRYGRPPGPLLTDAPIEP